MANLFRCTGGTNYDDYSGTTVDAAAMTSDDTYTYLKIPKKGIYDTDSMIRTLNGNLCGCIYLGDVTVTGVNASNAISVTMDCTSIPNYEKLTSDNFSYRILQGSTECIHLGSANGYTHQYLYITLSYDASTGILTITNKTNGGDVYAYPITYKVYAFIFAQNAKNEITLVGNNLYGSYYTKINTKGKTTLKVEGTLTTSGGSDEYIFYVLPTTINTALGASYHKDGAIFTKTAKSTTSSALTVEINESIDVTEYDEVYVSFTSGVMAYHTSNIVISAE